MVLLWTVPVAAAILGVRVGRSLVDEIERRTRQ
jgi:hypothetical protein